ncbi:hypothetical protein R1flu_025386 [Riccia fluitans]|uniref:Uncharacterized protein n=1 Tax=Riccia fluitans TaxID=41844 RepID=A0ABD1XY11_9MARC
MAGTSIDEYVGLLVSFQTIHGTYVSATPGGEGARLIQSVVNDVWEKFLIEDSGDGTYSIKSNAHGTYIRAYEGGGGSRVDMQTQVGPWEKFTLEQLPGCWAMKTAHSTYLRAEAGGAGAQMDQQTQVGPWEEFVINVESAVDQLINLTYDVDHANVVSTTPKALASQSQENNSDLEQSMSINIKTTYARKFTWTLKAGLKVGLKAGAKVTTVAGLPSIIDGKVQVSTEFATGVSTEFDWGKELWEVITFSASLPVKVPPKTMLKARVSFFESVMDVPWQATVTFVGTSTTKIISGDWKGSTVYDVTYVIDPPVGLA